MKNNPIVISSWTHNGMLYITTATPIEYANHTSNSDSEVPELISIFEYLGNRTPEYGIGDKVYTYAKGVGARVGTKEVATRSYNGKVMTYERSFLDFFFSLNPNPEVTTTSPDDDDLPF